MKTVRLNIGLDGIQLPAGHKIENPKMAYISEVILSKKSEKLSLVELKLEDTSKSDWADKQTCVVGFSVNFSDIPYNTFDVLNFVSLVCDRLNQECIAVKIDNQGYLITPEGFHPELTFKEEYFL